MGMDDFLGHLADKDALHKKIDKLKEGQIAWFIVQDEDDEQAYYTVNSVGGPTNASTLWMLRCMESGLFNE